MTGFALLSLSTLLVPTRLPTPTTQDENAFRRYLVLRPLMFRKGFWVVVTKNYQEL